MENNINVKILRTTENGSRFQSYEIERQEGMTVLGALIHIHDTIDETLSFDYNCRAGRCGTCGVVMNGKPTLACETQIPKTGEMVIEPKRSHVIIKDVLTDDPEIWKIRKEVLRLPFTPKTSQPFVIPPHQPERFNLLDSCIECGLCQSSCPNIKNGWIGPMHAVYTAKLDAHPLDTSDRSELLMRKGMRLCDTNFSCQRSCPKGITITQDAIIPEKEAWIDRNGIFFRIGRK